MKLSKLYSNKPDIFAPIDFRPGLNVVLADIRLPENREKDTHNLGKSTLGKIIDFCLLKRKSDSFFLFKHPNIFKDFVFFLELELLDGSFLTLKRSVANQSKISFKHHEAAHQDFSVSPGIVWDHTNLAFEKSRELLDSRLDLTYIKPWQYRKVVGYLLRTQDDYSNVFRLGKHRSKDVDWKPFLSHLLGFNPQNIDLHYKKKDELKSLKTEIKKLKNNFGKPEKDISYINGLLPIKRNAAEETQKLLDQFDFKNIDKEKTTTLVNDIDAKIHNLSAERYSLKYNIKKITESIAEEQMEFNSGKAEILFKEAGVLFAGQIRKDFDQLVKFNRAITDERKQYLAEELAELKNDLENTNKELEQLNNYRKELLSFLTDSDVFEKYKTESNNLVILRTEIQYLELQKENLLKIQNLEIRCRKLNEEIADLGDDIQKNTNSQNKESIFSNVRLYFNEIIKTVLNKDALLTLKQNKERHIEFNTEILDDKNDETSAGDGATYKKLLCIAFDLALLKFHLKGNFPRFVYHDGIFEGLDDRKKENLITLIREYSELGIQHIITLIDSDLPTLHPSLSPVFRDTEIILHLHDEGASGRLFKMEEW